MSKIDYEALLRDASITVIKQVLMQVAKNGFYKKQHLYITFSLKHPGVKISNGLRNEFGDDLTIVLQYEFWDLVVDDYGFSVSLAFENSNETLYIPYSSLITVSDPSEDFCLNFIPDLSDMERNKALSNENNNIISLDAFRHK